MQTAHLKILTAIRDELRERAAAKLPPVLSRLPAIRAQQLEQRRIRDNAKNGWTECNATAWLAEGGAPTARKRASRALQAMEKIGLVQIERENGLPLAVQLTPRGRRAISKHK